MIREALARAVLDGLPYDKVRDNLTVSDVQHALAAVWADLPAAVVDREALAEAMCRTEAEMVGNTAPGAPCQHHLRHADAILAAGVARDEAEVRRDERAKVGEEMWRLVCDWNANGNSRELGDPCAVVWHTCARELLALHDRLTRPGDRQPPSEGGAS